jgi:hypothetical protein
MQKLLELLKRLVSLIGFRKAGTKGEWPDTVGPADDEYPVVPVGEVLGLIEKQRKGMFIDGRWVDAAYKTMHSGRIGRGIVPQTLVVHTTDMRPGTFGALVTAWTTKAGRGNGAHFLIGKTKEDGVVQFAPITRNANHAGGPNPGGFRVPGAAAVTNPNVVSVGVEIDNAGRLTKDKNGWYHRDTGYRFAAEDVYVDSKGRGWEKVTQYQIDMLKYLWQDLRPLLKPWPAGTVVVPNATYASQGVLYAASVSPSLIGHASTNPINKTDPGPQVMALINGWV